MADFDNMIPRYDTREQIEAVRFQEPKPSMFVNSFFHGADVYSPTEKIEWDEVREGTGMARYVGEKLEVEATEREGYKTLEITPPKVQEKRVLGLEELKKRLPGENPYSSQTPAQRAQYYLDGDYAFCMDAIDRRREQQAAKMMVNGRVDIVGRGVNEYVEYDLPLKLNLAGTSRWGQGGKAFEDLRYMAQILMKRNYKPTMLLMETGVADVLIKETEWKEMLDNLRMEMGQIAPGPMNDIYETAQFFGKLKWAGIGELDLFTYNGTYKNDEGEEEGYLDEGRVLMLSAEAMQNRFMYGCVTFMDEQSRRIMSVEGRYVPQIFTDARAGTQTVMVTSRSMPAPFKSDSWWTAKVF